MVEMSQASVGECGASRIVPKDVILCVSAPTPPPPPPHLQSMGALRRLRRWAKQSHCGIPSESEAPKVHGHAVHSLAGFLGVKVEDLDRAVVFADPPILPLPTAKDEMRGAPA